jgi:hypothetical protein
MTPARFKLDENLGRRIREQFKLAGHTVSSVSEQDLCGTEDPTRLPSLCDFVRALSLLSPMDRGFLPTS